jgi:multiple sugar transport system ATP-binding protein
MASIDFQHVTKRFADGTVAVDDLTLDVNEGEFLILVGPSGCGKTTALRMVAGLEEVTSGSIRIGERVVNDVEPAKRDIAMVFQNYALYPHMTVAENIGFPLRQQRLPKPTVAERVSDVARLLGVEELMERKPNALSGGQRQRVAIGRALVRRPLAFLMDEPLSNLDAKLRVQMRAELISLHRRLGVTTVYVTHDQTEAMTLGDRVVVMRGGVVQQVDAPERLYREPRNTFVAGFIGSPAMNFLEGRLAEGAVQLDGCAVRLPDALRARLGRRTGPVLVGARPEDFELADGDAPDALSAAVEITEQLGPETLVYFRVDGAPAVQIDRPVDEEDGSSDLRGTLVARFDPSSGVRAGDRPRLRIKENRLQLFDRDSGVSLLA